MVGSIATLLPPFFDLVWTRKPVAGSWELGAGGRELVTPSLVGSPPLLWPQAVFICRPNYGDPRLDPNPPLEHLQSSGSGTRVMLAIESGNCVKCCPLVVHGWVLDSVCVQSPVSSHHFLPPKNSPGLKTEFFIASGRWALNLYTLSGGLLYIFYILN